MRNKILKQMVFWILRANVGACSSDFSFTILKTSFSEYLHVLKQTTTAFKPKKIFGWLITTLVRSPLLNSFIYFAS